MRKALLLTTVLFFITVIGNAQIVKGRTLLGGTVVYNQSSSYVSNNILFPGKQHYLTINPAFGIAVKENVIVGLEPSFSFSNQQSGTEADLFENKGRSYGASVFVRRYVPLLKKFYFFGQAAAGGNKNKSWQEYHNQTSNSTEGWGASVSFSPGLTYALTKKLYVESSLNSFALLGYAHSKTESTDSNTGDVYLSKGSNFTFSTSLGSGGGFSIGFQLLL
jgi:hypothetical protein